MSAVPASVYDDLYRDIISLVVLPSLGDAVELQGRCVDIVMAYIVMACKVMAYKVMAYKVMACKVMTYIVMACIVMAYIAMTYIVMAYIAMTYIVMAYTQQRAQSRPKV